MKSALSVLLLCFLLASCGEEKSVETAKELQERIDEANAHYDAAQVFYKDGVWSKAVESYFKAAELGHANAQYKMGHVTKLGFGVPEDDAEALKWYRKAAEQGQAQAECAIGDSYYSGNGVPKDFAKAMKWYRKAAAHGDVRGQYRVGYMYYLGKGVPVRDFEAMRWFRKAAEQGEADAYWTLGNMYKAGDGVPIDYAKAYMFYNLAAAGEKTYKDDFEEIKDAMTQAGIAEGEKLTREWLERKAKEKGE